MIVATAGHVDHGKTRLVKALTGIETDRLAEEKRRGLSIELGFAYRPLAEGSILGFVDVPGHERFLATAVAGVAAIDFALLVVAADDGPKPQTFEHLAILHLLGIDRGIVALTKIDRADERARAAAHNAVMRMLDGTTLQGAPVFPVSAESGEGLDALEGALLKAAGAHRPPPAEGGFRLAVDRAFILDGIGLVVTGAALAGRIAEGSILAVLPGGARARVRSLHANGRPSTEGRAGERLALNLAGLGTDAARRGDWLVAPWLSEPSTRIDINLSLLGSAPQALKHGARVHVHLGTADIPARIALLDTRMLAPGASARAQLVLDRATGALWGDRLILRDGSARHTLGGGWVVDPFAPARGRARRERLDGWPALETADPLKALGALMERTGEGIDLLRFAQARNLEAGTLEQHLNELGAVTTGSGENRRAFSPRRWAALKQGFTAALDAAHAAHPERAGEAPQALLTRTSRRLNEPAFEALIDALVAEGLVVRAGALLRRTHHRPQPSAAASRLWNDIRERLAADPLHPPTLSALASALGQSEQAIERTVAAAGREQAVRIARNRYLLPETLHHLADIAEREAGADKGSLSAAGFRDRADIGRNLAVDLLDYFDRVGFTRREGDRRRIIRPAAKIFAAISGEND